MSKELHASKNAIPSTWKVKGKDTIDTWESRQGEPHWGDFTLLLLTDKELEQLCWSYARTLLDLRWIREVYGWWGYSWSVEKAFTQARLGHFAEEWSKERVQSILDEVFEGYDPDRERAKCEALKKEQEEAERQGLPF